MSDKKELNQEQLEKTTGGTEINPVNNGEDPTLVNTRPAYVAGTMNGVLQDQANGDTAYGRQVDIVNDNDGYVNPWK